MRDPDQMRIGGRRVSLRGWRWPSAALLALLPATTEASPPPPPGTTSSRAAAPQVPSSDDTYDWLETKSGEWLKGRFIELEDNVVRFDSDEFDEQSIDWVKVRELHTAEPHVVVLRSAQLVGRIHVVHNRVTVQDEFGNRTEVERWRVHRMVVAGNREFERWYADLDLGLSASQGNTSSGNLNAGFGFGRVGAVVDFEARYDGTVTLANRELIANKHRGLTSFTYAVVYDVGLVPALVLAQHDRFRNVFVQLLPASAVKWDAISLPRLDWSVGSGVGYVYNLTVSSAEGESRDTHDLAFLLFTQVEWDVTKWLEFELDHQTTVVPTNFDFTNHHLRTGLEFDITNALEIDFSFVWDHMDQPQTDADGVTPVSNDFQFITSISLELGAAH